VNDLFYKNYKKEELYSSYNTLVLFPVLRAASYSALLALLLSTSYASLMASNLSLLPSGLSGWHLAISLRYCLRTPLAKQSYETPRIS